MGIVSWMALKNFTLAEFAKLEQDCFSKNSIWALALQRPVEIPDAVLHNPADPANQVCPVTRTPPSVTPPVTLWIEEGADAPLHRREQTPLFTGEQTPLFTGGADAPLHCVYQGVCSPCVYQGGLAKAPARPRAPATHVAGGAVLRCPAAAGWPARDGGSPPERRRRARKACGGAVSAGGGACMVRIRGYEAGPGGAGDTEI